MNMKLTIGIYPSQASAMTVWTLAGSWGRKHRICHDGRNFLHALAIENDDGLEERRISVHIDDCLASYIGSWPSGSYLIDYRTISHFRNPTGDFVFVVTDVAFIWIRHRIKLYNLYNIAAADHEPKKFIIYS